MSVSSDSTNQVLHPIRWLRGVCGGHPVYPLIVLFGLNAVDELDRTAFGILLPEIRAHFGLDLSTMLAVVALASIASLALQVPIAQYADRSRRVPLAIVGAIVWAGFSGMTGLAVGVVMLTIARSGSAIGKAVIDPTHNSLIADLYPVERRSQVFSVHRAANAIGGFIGPLSAGLLAYSFGWRVPFLIFVIPTIVFAILAFRISEPKRGRFERAAAGATPEIIDTEETVPSVGESWRTVHKVASLRRLWAALPFLAVALVGFVVLASLLYDQEFGLDERARGVAAAITEPFQLVGIIIGARIASRRFAGNISGLVRFLGTLAVIASLASAGFALAPNIVVAVAVNCIISATLAALVPGLLAALSLAIPPRARATGFSVASLWAIPGLLVLPLIGWIADEFNIRVGLMVVMPLFFIGSMIIRSVADVIEEDVAQVWQATAARSEATYLRTRGESALLLVRGVDSGYGYRQVLFGVDIEIREGEIVALLGTNGAGKSTLINTISGIVEADRGTIVLDGRDITHAPPHEIAELGIVQMPGGQGIFPSLSVREHLELAGWTRRKDQVLLADAISNALAAFPILERRLTDAAGDLSGGQQQMLTLAMAMVTQPRILLIDELSLGLAPVVVAELLPKIRRLADSGVAVILIEQSVNIALKIADRAYFIERGQIGFDGPTADLLERRDLLRSIFLARSSKHSSVAGTSSTTPGSDRLNHDLPAMSRPNDSETPTALETTSLGRSFGGIRAVDAVSVHIAQREIIGIIGPNGAGKTTLFDLITGFIPSETGVVRLEGRDITGLDAAQRANAGLGRSFQNAKLFPELSVRESLAVALERWISNRSALAAALHLPMVYDDERRIGLRVAELIEMMGLGDLADVRVRDLSTGSRRIVDIACQVAHRPTVILLDEPSSGIAQREAEALLPLLLRLRDDMGSTLAIIEHDISLISAVSDRLIAMDQGRVIASGQPDRVLEDPVVIESYLGTDPTVLTRSDL